MICRFDNDRPAKPLHILQNGGFVDSEQEKVNKINHCKTTGILAASLNGSAKKGIQAVLKTATR